MDKKTKENKPQTEKYYKVTRRLPKGAKIAIVVTAGLAVAAAIATPLIIDNIIQPWPTDLPGYTPDSVEYSDQNKYTISGYNLPSALVGNTTVYYSVNGSAFQPSQTFTNLVLEPSNSYDTQVKLVAAHHIPKIIKGDKLAVDPGDPTEEVKSCFPFVPTNDKYSQGWIYWDNTSHQPLKIESSPAYTDAIIGNISYYDNTDPTYTPLTSIKEVGSYTAVAHINIPSYGYQFDVTKVFTIEGAQWPSTITYAPGQAAYNSAGTYTLPVYNPNVDNFPEGTIVYQYGMQERGSDATPYSSDTSTFTSVDLKYNHSYNIQISLHNPNFSPAYKLYFTNAGGSNAFTINSKGPAPEASNYELNKAKLNVAHEDMKPLSLNDGDIIVKGGPRPTEAEFTYDGKTWDNFKDSAAGTYDVGVTLKFENDNDLTFNVADALTIRANEKLYSIKADRLNQTVGNTSPLTKEDIELNSEATAIDDGVTFTYNGSSTFPTTCGVYTVVASFTVSSQPVTITGALHIKQAETWPAEMTLPNTQKTYVASGSYPLNPVTNAPAGSMVVYSCNGWTSQPYSVDTPVSEIPFTDTTLLGAKFYRIKAIVSNPDYLYPKTLEADLNIVQGESGVTVKITSPDVLDAQVGTTLAPTYGFDYAGPATSADVDDSGVVWVKKNSDGTWTEVGKTTDMPATASVDAIGTYSLKGTVSFKGKYQDIVIDPDTFSTTDAWDLDIKHHTGTITCDTTCTLSKALPTITVYESIAKTDYSISVGGFVVTSESGYHMTDNWEGHMTLTGCTVDDLGWGGNTTNTTLNFSSFRVYGSVREDFSIVFSAIPNE